MAEILRVSTGWSKLLLQGGSVNCDGKRFNHANYDPAICIGARISPDMVGAALNDDITRLQLDDLTTVQHKFQFARYDSAVID